MNLIKTLYQETLNMTEDMNIRQQLEGHQDELIKIYETINSKTKSVKELCLRKGIEYSESIRVIASKLIDEGRDFDNTTTTETTQYKTAEENFPAKVSKQPKIDMPSAWCSILEKFLTIEEYCDRYGLDINSVKSSKLVTHNATHMTYNIAFFEDNSEPAVDVEELKNILVDGIANLSYIKRKAVSKRKKVGVVKIADLHLGSVVENLIKTKDFNINILVEKLGLAVEEINSRNYSEVHVHILGDLIESFTGMSHINSWKSLDKNLIGAEAIKMAVKVLHESFLSKIDNLGEVKIIAGNHDRVTSNNKEDVEGDAAKLISWGLELIGYPIEFNSIVITHVVDGIAHILTHGHHGISKKSTKQLCWDYGVQGKYNLICEGHLHSIIQKLNVKQHDSFTTIQDDAVDHRRMNCPSFFTGNYYSETLGYTSESGFVITEDNGRGIPNVFYYAL